MTQGHYDSTQTLHSVGNRYDLTQNVMIKPETLHLVSNHYDSTQTLHSVLNHYETQSARYDPTPNPALGLKPL